MIKNIEEGLVDWIEKMDGQDVTNLFDLKKTSEKSRSKEHTVKKPKNEQTQKPKRVKIQKEVSKKIKMGDPVVQNTTNINKKMPVSSTGDEGLDKIKGRDVLTQDELMQEYSQKFNKMYPRSARGTHVDSLKFMKILEDERRIQRLKYDKKRLMRIARQVLIDKEEKRKLAL